MSSHWLVHSEISELSEKASLRAKPRQGVIWFQWGKIIPMRSQSWGQSLVGMVCGWFDFSSDCAEENKPSTVLIPTRHETACHCCLGVWMVSILAPAMSHTQGANVWLKQRCESWSSGQAPCYCLIQEPRINMSPGHQYFKDDWRLKTLSESW